MSETEHYKGKLIPTGKTLEEFLEGKNMPSFYTDKMEYFEDEYSTKFYCIENLIYEVESEIYEDCDSIFESHKNKDGTINFDIKYYNGGCGFNEALHEAINNNKTE